MTAGARGSAYAFRPAGGKPPLTARVPVLKVGMFIRERAFSLPLSPLSLLIHRSATTSRF